jgi:penicillin amidase
LDGASGRDIDKEFLISPKSVCSKPKWNYVYPQTINQSQSMVFLSRILSPEDRAKRITQLLEPKSNWDKAAVVK